MNNRFNVTAGRFGCLLLALSLVHTVASAAVPTEAPEAKSSRISQQEANKALFRRAAEELFVKRDFSSIDRNYAANYVQHNERSIAAAQAQGITAVESTKRFFAALFKGLPDMKPTIEHLYAEGDKVVGFVTWRGTHTGEFMGFPATGKKIEIRTADLFRVEKGRFVEHWDVVDESGMMAVLMPPPGTTAPKQ